jgi:hypothetical protein
MGRGREMEKYLVRLERAFSGHQTGSLGQETERKVTRLRARKEDRVKSKNVSWAEFTPFI